MPMLKECLPVIDQAENMHCEVPEHDSVDCNLEELESNLLCKNISLLKEDLCAYQKSSVRGSANVASMRECSELMSTFRKQLMGIFRHDVIDMPQSGNIRVLQQNVTENRLGSRACIMNTNDIDLNVIGSCPIQNKRHTRRLKSGNKRNRNHVRLPKSRKVRCMHCDNNVFFVIASKTSHCNNCECLFPLNESHCSISIASKCLKGQRVLIVFEQSDLQWATIMDIHYPDNDGERYLTLLTDARIQLTEVYASLCMIRVA